MKEAGLARGLMRGRRQQAAGGAAGVLLLLSCAAPAVGLGVANLAPGDRAEHLVPGIVCHSLRAQRAGLRARGRAPRAHTSTARPPPCARVPAASARVPARRRGRVPLTRRATLPGTAGDVHLGRDGAAGRTAWESLYVGGPGGQDGFLRGGGSEPDVLKELQTSAQSLGGTIGRLLDKDDGLMTSYYDQGDKTLQDWAKTAQKTACNAQQYVTNVVLPAGEQALLRGYYLATHPPEAEEALKECGRNALATAKTVKNSIPGVRSIQRDIRNRWLQFRIEGPVRSEVLSTAGAAITAYLSVIAAAQRMAYAQGLSHYTSKGQPAQILGVAAVAIAGVAAAEASHFVAQQLRPNTYKLASANPMVSVRKEAARLAPLRRRGALDRVADAAVSLAFFKFLLRGSFRKIAPADLTKPGPFAREWVETSGENYATYGQRMRVNSVGWKRGCHHCGTRGAGGFLWISKKWICDHQPPNKIVAMGQVLEQRFYPHCQSCSAQQSTALRFFGDARFERSVLKLHNPQGANILGSSFLSVYPIVHYISTLLDARLRNSAISVFFFIVFIFSIIIFLVFL